ncbi:hypothetical protein [Paenibacillus sp. UMB4589-SE434]|uniref:hypothetical protein n=1 Tax=Paenibacillus sp. UMB4589-SE434 TaxID=3046314 RepID=UPI00254A2596|nr:hypothetical protein [Paenibacillus sp. UMB4589-SE434]MDK8183355.1 hypothetical protein [Paenibacillus sp. UMB4589-SE434]
MRKKSDQISNRSETPEESLLTRAIDLDDLEEAEKLFDILENQAETDPQILYYRAKELKKYDRAISYAI